MKNLKDRNKQHFGHKRIEKVLKRKRRKIENLVYVSKLMIKYGRDLKLNERAVAGEKYLKDSLNG